MAVKQCRASAAIESTSPLLELEKIFHVINNIDMTHHLFITSAQSHDRQAESCQAAVSKVIS